MKKTVDGDSRMPHSASVMSATRRTLTPAKVHLDQGLFGAQPPYGYRRVVWWMHREQEREVNGKHVLASRERGLPDMPRRLRCAQEGMAYIVLRGNRR
jgi:hypothetical protein